MRRNKNRNHTGRLVTWGSAALLVAGSIALAGPAVAAQPNTPSAQSAQGQQHQQSGQAKHDAAPSRATTTRTHSGTASQGSSQSGSGVSLAKPNGYQAQSDPDGMTNGGVDQPGGTGGVNTSAQDGNNGSGNDIDCEDDNRGISPVPGCLKRAEVHAAHQHVPGTTDEVPSDTVPSQGGTVPTLGGVVPTLGGTVATLLLQGTVPTTTTTTAVPGTSAVLVSAPTSAAGQPQGQAKGQVEAQSVTRAAAHAGPAAAVLPNTGAGQALLGLAMAALAALAAGAGLVLRGRRPASVVAR